MTFYDEFQRGSSNHPHKNFFEHFSTADEPFDSPCMCCVPSCRRTQPPHLFTFAVQLLDSLLASNDSVAFREPVDWVGLNLTDYTTIIKRPMDLGTVKRQWQQGLYSTPEECAVDVRLIWDNCRTYNAGGVPRRLHKASEVLSSLT